MYLPVNEQKTAWVTAPKDRSSGYGFKRRKDGM